MRGQLTSFKGSLEDFAKHHKREINKDPEFRAHFQKMCQSIGVDPLASNKGFWAELLGVGDFYYELGIQIADVCLATRGLNGGLIEMASLQRVLQRVRKSESVGVDDIERAIRKLKRLGNGFEIRRVGSKTLVQSVPCELNMDHMAILQLAQGSGFTTRSDILKKLKWEAERVEERVGPAVRESWLQIIDAIDCLERVANSVFERIEERVTTEQTVINGLSGRIDKAMSRISALQGTSRAVVVQSNPKYPATGIARNTDVVFGDGLLAGPTHWDYAAVALAEAQEIADAAGGSQEGSDLEAAGGAEPSEEAPRPAAAEFGMLAVRPTENQVLAADAAARAALQRRMAIEDVPVEGLGPQRDEIASASSLVLFNTSRNAFADYAAVDNLSGPGGEADAADAARRAKSADIHAAPQTLREELPEFGTVDYNYRPQVDAIPQMQLPTVLPGLGSVADLNWATTTGINLTPIAPSARLAESRALLLDDGTPAGPPPPPSGDTPQLPSGAAQPAPSGAPPPPPPPPPSASRPPPPPPPPPVQPARSAASEEEGPSGADLPPVTAGRRGLLDAIVNFKSTSKLKPVERDDSSPAGARRPGLGVKAKTFAGPLSLGEELQMRLQNRRFKMQGQDADQARSPAPKSSPLAAAPADDDDIAPVPRAQVDDSADEASDPVDVPVSKRVADDLGIPGLNEYLDDRSDDGGNSEWEA